LPLLSLLVVLVFFLGACGGSSEPGEKGPTTSGPPSTASIRAAGADETGRLTVYSGRSEELIAELVTLFEEQTGIQTQVRYGDSAELAGTVLEERGNSPADVFFAQDAGALGALAKAERLEPLPEELLSRVDPRFRSEKGEWVGVSGRARVLVYNSEALTEAELPRSTMDLTDPKWKGQIGWAPTNGSFQAFVTAMRVSAGEDAAREWLRGVQANQPKIYEGNTAIVDAVAAGEVQIGLVNHYYLHNLEKERGELAAENYFFPSQDPGNLVNVAGAGILESADNPASAQQFVRFLLSQEAQTYFADETSEYPLVAGVEPGPGLKPLGEIAMPAVDLTDLDSLEQTLTLLQELGII